MHRPLRATFACGLAVFACCLMPAGEARSDQQRDPELKALLQRIIGSSDCFTDKYESEVWYKAMEPRLSRFVSTHDARVEILNHVYCEAKRDPDLQMPPDLILALMEVESRFDPLGSVSGGRRGSHASHALLAARTGGAEPTGAGRSQHSHGLRNPALLPARREPQLVARPRPLQRQRRPQHLPGVGDAALAAFVAVLSARGCAGSANPSGLVG